MTVIIAGHFAQQDEVKQAIAALQRAGAPPDQISSFYVNPAGQHDLFPIGGDRDESPGAEDSDKDTAIGLGTGGVIGGAAGAAARTVRRCYRGIGRRAHRLTDGIVIWYR